MSSLVPFDLTQDDASPAGVPQADAKPKRSRKKPASMLSGSPGEPAVDLAEGSVPKKQKIPKAPKAPKAPAKKPAVEKRVDKKGATLHFSSKPNQKTKERIERALGVGAGMNHRLFLISSSGKQSSPQGGPSQAFTVLGATGNVYDVTICRNPHCTCPDHARGNVCKHILFTMLRVLRLASDNPIVWQKALLTAEVEEALAGAGGVAAQGVMADARVAQQWQAATGSPASKQAAAVQPPAGPVRRPVEGECSICFESMEGPEALTWCASCGNNIHRVCFGKWAAAKQGSGLTVTCTLCRAPWRDGDNPGGAAEVGRAPQQYMNLSQGAAQPAMMDLYGANALWIDAHAGNISRRTAARGYRASQGRG